MTIVTWFQDEVFLSRSTWWGEAPHLAIQHEAAGGEDSSSSPGLGLGPELQLLPDPAASGPLHLLSPPPPPIPPISPTAPAALPHLLAPCHLLLLHSSLWHGVQPQPGLLAVAAVARLGRAQGCGQAELVWGQRGAWSYKGAGTRGTGSSGVQVVRDKMFYPSHYPNTDCPLLLHPTPRHSLPHRLPLHRLLLCYFSPATAVGVTNVRGPFNN